MINRLACCTAAKISETMKKSMASFFSGMHSVGDLFPEEIAIPEVKPLKLANDVWSDVGECFEEVWNEMREAIEVVNVKE